MAEYEVVYVDGTSLSPPRLKSDAGKAIIKLLAAYDDSLRRCFPSAFQEGGRYFVVRDLVDAACGVSSAARKRANLADAIARNVVWSEEVFIVVDGRGRYVAGCTTRHRRDKSKANEIDSVCVSEKHRGRGVCGVMIASAAKLYSDRGDDVKIACVTSNQGACKCYSRVFERKRRGSHVDLGNMTLFSGIRKDVLPAAGPRKL